MQTNFIRLSNDPNKFIIDIPQADGINHVVIFLTGVEPFPVGFGGQIYFSWPDPHNQIVWHLLGHISNEKPSAIFKISNLKKGEPNNGVNLSAINSSFFGQLAQGSIHNAQIGISLEPMGTILQSTPADSTDPSKVSNFVEFTRKMLENFVNYASSFGDVNYISLNTVNNWYENFQRRLQADPNFWR